MRRSALARRLEAARRILAEAGVPILSITQTAPLEGPGAGPLRVVRARDEAEGIHLLVAAETVSVEADDSRN